MSKSTMYALISVGVSSVLVGSLALVLLSSAQSPAEPTQFKLPKVDSSKLERETKKRLTRNVPQNIKPIPTPITPAELTVQIDSLQIVSANWKHFVYYTSNPFAIAVNCVVVNNGRHAQADVPIEIRWRDPSRTIPKGKASLLAKFENGIEPGEIKTTTVDFPASMVEMAISQRPMNEHSERTHQLEIRILSYDQSGKPILSDDWIVAEFDEEGSKPQRDPNMKALLELNPTEVIIDDNVTFEELRDKVLDDIRNPK